MKAKEVKEITWRGSRSSIASKMRAKDDFEHEVSITVSQGAPCNLKENGTWPAKEGYKEINKDADLKDVGEPGKVTEIWIKTATYGGRKRIWIR